MKNIAVLGSTGSIGTQTLDVVRAQSGDALRKSTGSRSVILHSWRARSASFIRRLQLSGTKKKQRSCGSRTADLPVKIVSGMEGLLEIAQMEEAEVLVTAIVGMIGIRPTIAAIKAGKDIALANKETLVTAGHIIMPLAKEYNVKILPVDSEHSAIFQSLNGEEDNTDRQNPADSFRRSVPRKEKHDELKNVQVEDALKHPNWAMGQ